MLSNATVQWRLISAAILAGAVGFTWWFLSGQVPELPVGVSQTEYRLAARESKLEIGRNPGHFDILFRLSERAMQNARWETAVSCLEGIPASHTQDHHEVDLLLGVCLVRLNRAGKAEKHLRLFLRRERSRPQNRRDLYVQALRQLDYLLVAQLRFEERQVVLKEILEQEESDSAACLEYCFPGLLQWNHPYAVSVVEKFLAQEPNNFRLRVALGRYRIGQYRLEEARTILETCCRERPEDLFARAALLNCLYQQCDRETFAEACKNLPPAGENEPWLLMRIRGRYHIQHKRYREAVTCFRRAANAEPTNPETYLGLTRAYAGLNRPEEQQQAAKKASILARIKSRMSRAQKKPDDQKPFVEIARLCKEIQFDERAGMIGDLSSKLFH